MTFHQLKYFITLAECLSFTEAAKCLFITQPALSRQISAMEEELGTKLVIRDKKKLKLTPGGNVLYNRWQSLLSDYNDSIAEARSANQGFEGKIRIGFLDTYDIGEIFSDVLHRFGQDYPKIQMQLERYSLGELPQKLYEDSLDLILTYGFSLFDQPDLMTVDIQGFESYLMMNRNHPMADQEKVALTDFQGERFVQLADYICEEGHRYILSLFNKCGMHPDLMNVGKMEDVMLWVQTGNAVAITTNRTTEKYNPDVVLRPIDMEETKGHWITMGWHKNNHNPAISIFMEMLEQMQQGRKL